MRMVVKINPANPVKNLFRYTPLPSVELLDFLELESLGIIKPLDEFECHIFFKSYAIWLAIFNLVNFW
ncbi:hypothetical protein B6U96_12275 [Archaeoglobales archaeon ex4484_92]|nr:MAG: hypothetical protein B6U96_12275 [Archaeoglobales archaeon ex4484_92]